jgi:hypothetical protein
MTTLLHALQWCVSVQVAHYVYALTRVTHGIETHNV